MGHYFGDLVFNMMNLVTGNDDANYSYYQRMMVWFIAYNHEFVLVLFISLCR